MNTPNITKYCQTENEVEDGITYTHVWANGTNRIFGAMFGRKGLELLEEILSHYDYTTLSTEDVRHFIRCANNRQ